MTGVSTATRLLTARWVLPIASPPVEHGGVEINGEGISAIYTAEQMAEQKQRRGAHEIESLGEAIIMPGLINLHTHLDWTAQELFDTRSSLFDWIPGLVGGAKHWSMQDFLTSAAAGAHRIARSGTTCVLDSSFTGQAAVALTARGLRGVVGLELFGLDDSKLEENWNKWLDRKEQLIANARISDKVTISVAPHAPYSVSPALMRKAMEWAADQKLPITMHIAESPNEQRWILSGDEKIDRFLQSVHVLPGNDVNNIQYRACGRTPVGHLESENLLPETLVAAHCVQLDDDDIDILARRRVKVAHCPRSNARLRNGIAPLRKLLDNGVEVGFGTDSAASTDNLDVLAEARFASNLHRAVDPMFPFDSERIISALTLGSARALGMSHLIGSLERGKQADLAIFNIVSDGVWAAKSPYDALLYGNVVLHELLVGGRKVSLDGLY